jgi:hydroxypyruvate isomerase
MPTFAANLTTMFNEVEFMDRFGHAKRAGFNAVEYLFPYAYDTRDIAAELSKHQLQQVLFNTPPGDWDKGERGLAAIPGRSEEFLDGINTALDYAKILNCPRVHPMAGLLTDPANATRYRDQYVNNIQAAARLCAQAGVDLLIEPINPINMPDYFINDFQLACDIIEELNEPNIKLQFDIFHCQRLYGEVPSWLHKCGKHIAHFQIAGTPDRHEPNIGDLPYKDIIKVIEEIGLGDLAIGCEYNPKNRSEDGLGWINSITS